MTDLKFTTLSKRVDVIDRKLDLILEKLDEVPRPKSLDRLLTNEEIQLRKLHEEMRYLRQQHQKSKPK
jgi:hypothetical protein